MAMAVALSGAAAFAQSLSEGFYRVQNNGSKRFLYVRDCTGDVSTVGTDMGALELWSNQEDAISDPGSVIYLKKVGDKCDLQSQATGVYEITESYLQVYYDGEFCQVSQSGQYLYELGVSDFNPDMGIIGARTDKEAKDIIKKSNYTHYKLWITPKVDSNTSNYFGFKPTVNAGGKYYAPFYADFAYTPKNAVKTWYVSKVDKQNAIAVIKEITGTVAKSQAVFVECTGTTPSANKVDLTTATGTAAAGNVLKGVMFDNGDRSNGDHSGKNPAFVAFDANTMRVLGKDADGNLAFVNNSENLTTLEAAWINKKWDYSGVKAIPHNQSYLPVEADCPATLKVMTEAEYSEFMASQVKPGDVNNDGKISIVDATGIINFIIGGTTTGLNKDAADVNGDGKITIIDATLVIDKIVNNK